MTEIEFNEQRFIDSHREYIGIGIETHEDVVRDCEDAINSVLRVLSEAREAIVDVNAVCPATQAELVTKVHKERARSSNTLYSQRLHEFFSHLDEQEFEDWEFINFESFAIEMDFVSNQLKPRIIEVAKGL